MAAVHLEEFEVWYRRRRADMVRDAICKGVLQTVTLLPLWPCNDGQYGKFRPSPGPRSRIPASPGCELSEARDSADDGLMQLRLPRYLDYLVANATKTTTTRLSC
jgi:hypothetical protein